MIDAVCRRVQRDVAVVGTIGCDDSGVVIVLRGGWSTTAIVGGDRTWVISRN